jgi:hypothetical protein
MEQVRSFNDPSSASLKCVRSGTRHRTTSLASSEAILELNFIPAGRSFISDCRCPAFSTQQARKR